MPAVDATSALQALGETYRAVTASVRPLEEPDYARPSRCEGWVVRDVLFHLLLDAQRALVAFASPATEEPTTDFVEYWRPYRPGTEGALRHAEFVRRASAAYPRPSILAEEWEETSEAALRAAATAVGTSWAQAHLLRRAARSRGREPITPHTGRVHTQGLVTAVPDFLATLAVEAALHHLDLTLELSQAPPTPPGALRIVRATLDGLLGAASPAAWDHQTYALKGTGRMPVDDDDRRLLGPLAERLPLLG